jgi:hypothetical protein
MSLRDEELSRETLIFVPFETDNDIDRPSRRGTLCIATQVLCALCALATVSLSLREKGQKATSLLQGPRIKLALMGFILVTRKTSQPLS